MLLKTFLWSMYSNCADSMSFLRVAAGNCQSNPGHPRAVHHGDPQIVGSGGNIGWYGEFGRYLITLPIYPRRLVEIFIYAAPDFLTGIGVGEIHLQRIDPVSPADITI